MRVCPLSDSIVDALGLLETEVELVIEADARGVNEETGVSDTDTVEVTVNAALLLGLEDTEKILGEEWALADTVKVPEEDFTFVSEAAVDGDTNTDTDFSPLEETVQVADTDIELDVVFDGSGE